MASVQYGDLFTIPYHTMPSEGDEIQWSQSMRARKATYIPLLVILNKSTWANSISQVFELIDWASDRQTCLLFLDETKRGEFLAKCRGNRAYHVLPQTRYSSELIFVSECRVDGGFQYGQRLDGMNRFLVYHDKSRQIHQVSSPFSVYYSLLTEFILV